jgi:NADPH:quinone reductase-like Zn-dependent oxidoreductase
MAHVSSATAAAAASAAALAPARMRAVLLRAFGGPEALSLVRDAPTPRHGAHDVLVRVAAAGVNPLDCRVRALAFIHARTRQAVSPQGAAPAPPF